MGLGCVVLIAGAASGFVVMGGGTTISGAGVVHLAAPPGPTQARKGYVDVALTVVNNDPSTISGTYHFETIPDDHPTVQFKVDFLGSRSCSVVGNVCKITGLARMVMTWGGSDQTYYGYAQAKLIDNLQPGSPPGTPNDWSSLRFNGQIGNPSVSFSGSLSTGDISIE